MISERRLKGILKNGSAAADDDSDEEEGLMCNVPEHHDLVSFPDLPSSILDTKFYISGLN